MGLVIADETISQGLAGHHLHLGVEGGANRQPALVKLLAAVALFKVATNLLGEEAGSDGVWRERAGIDGQGLTLGLVAVGLADVAILDHAVDDEQLLDLAVEGLFARQQEVLGDLLGDGRGALRPLALVTLHVIQAGAQDALGVHAAMLVEILVLGRQERRHDDLRYRLDRNEHPALGRIFGKQRAVAGMDAGHHRRLVVGELRIVRKVPGIFPHHEAGTSRPHEEHNGTGREHDADQAKDVPHRKPRRFSG